MSRGLPRTAYLAIGFLMNVMLGTAYAWSVFQSELTKKIADGGHYGATTFEGMLPFALQLAMFSVGMVFAGRLVDRHGPRKVAMVGGVLVGVGYILSSLLDRTPWPVPWLTVTYGVIVGLGIGFAYNPPIPTAVKWFPDRKGLASGVTVMGFGLSALFTAPIATALIAGSWENVSMTFLILGIVFFIGLVLLGAMLRFPPADWKPPEPKATATKRTWKPLAELDTRAMVRTSSFWAAWIMYAVGTAGGFMIIGNAKRIAEPLSSAALALVAVQILAVFNSIGRPIFGRVADVSGVRKTLLVMYPILIVAMAILAISTSYWPTVAGIAITGVVFGGFLAVMPALATFFYGSKHVGTNYGLLFTGYGLGAIVALFAGGALHTAFGSWVPAYYAGIALSLVGLVLAILVRPPKTEEPAKESAAKA